MKLNEREVLTVQDALEDYVNSIQAKSECDNLSKGHIQTLESQKFKVQDLLSKIQAYNEWFEHQI